MFAKTYFDRVARAYGRLCAQKAANKGEPLPVVESARLAGLEKGRKIAQVSAILTFLLPATVIFLATHMGWTIFLTILLGYIMVILANSPVFLIFAQDSRRTKQLEKQLVDVLYKVGTNLASGTITLPRAILNVANETSEPARLELKKVANRLIYARVPFDEAIKVIARDNDSPLIYNICALLSAAYKEVKEEHASTVLTEAATTMTKIKMIEEEKAAAMSEPISNLVIILVFMLPIMVTIVSKLVDPLAPLLAMSPTIRKILAMFFGGTTTTGVLDIRGIATILRHFLLVEGSIGIVLTGLLIKRDIIWAMKLLAMFLFIFMVTLFI